MMASEPMIDIRVSEKFHGEMYSLLNAASDDRWYENGIGEGIGPACVQEFGDAWETPVKENTRGMVIRFTAGAAKFLLWDFDSVRFDIWADEEQHGFIRTGLRVRAELRAWLEGLLA